MFKSFQWAPNLKYIHLMFNLYDPRGYMERFLTGSYRKVHLPSQTGVALSAPVWRAVVGTPTNLHRTPLQ